MPAHPGASNKITIAMHRAQPLHRPSPGKAVFGAIPRTSFGARRRPDLPPDLPTDYVSLSPRQVSAKVLKPPAAIPMIALPIAVMASPLRSKYTKGTIPGLKDKDGKAPWPPVDSRSPRPQAARKASA